MLDDDTDEPQLRLGEELANGGYWGAFLDAADRAAPSLVPLLDAHSTELSPRDFSDSFSGFTSRDPHWRTDSQRKRKGAGAELRHRVADTLVHQGFERNRTD